jgi:hypothetical protein
VREARQVNHHAAIRVSERAQQLARCRRSVFATEYGYTRETFERAVVSFGIDGADDLEQAWTLVGVRIDQALPSGKWDSTPAQFGDEALGHLRRENRGPSAVREVNHGAVFGDDAIDEVQVASYQAQFVEEPARDQQHNDTAGAGRGNRIPHCRVQNVAQSDGAVVVQRDD